MKEGEKIRIVIVDDHPIIRQGLTTLLQAEPDLSVVGEAGDGAQAVETILALRPDVAILNLHMPRLDGIEVIRRVRKSNSETRLAVFTMSRDEKIIEEAFRAGASAYLFKGGAERQLIEVVHTVMEGGVCISPLLETVAEAERRRIARELRDTALRSLAGVKRDLKLLRPHLDSASAEALDRLKRSQELLSIALDQIRRVAHDLSPPDRSDVN